MRRVGSLALGLALTVAFGWAQTTKPVKVVFPNEGDREVWVGPIDSPGTVKSTEPASGTSISIEAPADPAKLSVFVHDKKTGNVAVKALADVQKTGEWKVAGLDERFVFAMKFLVTSEGKPVASALVKATVGGQSRTALIGPSDQGVGTIYGLPVGPVEVSVEYKTGTTNKSTPPQTFEAKMNVGPAVPKPIAIPDKVETIAEPAKAEASGKEEKSGKADTADKAVKSEAPEPRRPSEPGPNPIVGFLNLLIGLAVIGGICYVAFRYIKTNPDQFDAFLKKFGLGQPQAPAEANQPPMPQQPQPMKPIVLGDSGASPTPTAAVSPMAAGPAVAVANPRLVKADGSVVLLQEGSSIVGREAGLAVSLEGESSVSRHHARLDRAGDAVRLVDTGSTNGTYVNGAKISGEATLSPGDSVQFGAVAFRYEA